MLEVDTCHEEDVGGLLNEIRVRCVDPNEIRAPSVWVVGAKVDSSLVESVCG